MRGLLADMNVEGQVDALVTTLETPEWRDLWNVARVPVLRLRVLGLASTTPDSTIWQVCQEQELVLITGNRNADGADSLNATIQRLGTVESLPVITIADADRILTDRAYCERTAAKLFEYLIDIETVRGSGRLYIP